MARTDLTDKQWQALEPHLPANPRRGHDYREHRQVINGIVWRLKTGAPWRDIPERYGARSSPLGLRLVPFTEGRRAGTGLPSGSAMVRGSARYKPCKPRPTPRAISTGMGPLWTAVTLKPSVAPQVPGSGLLRAKKGVSRRRVVRALAGWAYQ